MADLLKYGLFAGAAWVAYEYFIKPATATPATPATGAPASPAAQTPAANFFKSAGATTLDAVYAKLGAAAGPNFQGTVDDWNYYLMQAIPGFTAPDPGPIFSSVNFTPPWTRDMKMAIGAYWVPMSQYLIKNQGLSGGGLRGLGCMTDVILANAGRRY